MKGASLTADNHGANSLSMRWQDKTGYGLMRGGWALIAVGLLGGCINVAAPDKPIVIELNINIRSEVIYQLAEDTAETIEENADIF